MSSASQDPLRDPLRDHPEEQQSHRAQLLRELLRELRQLNGLGASFLRAASARVGMTPTDVQVLDMLENADSMTAGQLADLSGLSTGAITGMLNRLEEAGLVRRERDPADARRVLVRLAPSNDARSEFIPTFTALNNAWEHLAAPYDDEQIAFLLAFLKHSNAITQQELARLREGPQGQLDVFSTPLGELTSGQLVVSGMSRLILRGDDAMSELYQARFEGPVPDVKTKDGMVSIRFPRRLLVPGRKQGATEVRLNAAIPWRIMIQGGASELNAELGGLDLAGLEAKGGMSMIRLELPAPSGAVPIRISGGASEVMIRRPPDVAARVHLKGWASDFTFDDQRFSYLGNDVRLQSPGYDAATGRYDIEVACSVSSVAIISG